MDALSNQRFLTAFRKAADSSTPLEDRQEAEEAFLRAVHSLIQEEVQGSLKSFEAGLDKRVEASFRRLARNS